MVDVAFVCLGNICRSPMAEAIMRQRLQDRGISGITVHQEEQVDGISVNHLTKVLKRY